jgi:hypothetical protein
MLVTWGLARGRPRTEAGAWTRRVCLSEGVLHPIGSQLSPKRIHGTVTIDLSGSCSLRIGPFDHGCPSSRPPSVMGQGLQSGPSFRVPPSFNRFPVHPLFPRAHSLSSPFPVSVPDQFSRYPRFSQLNGSPDPETSFLVKEKMSWWGSNCYCTLRPLLCLRLVPCPSPGRW